MAGNVNSGQRKDKLIREALMLAANRVHDDDPEGRRKLTIAAAKVVELAVGGDLAAFKELADRLDGKPVQSTTVSGPDGEAIPIGMRVSFVNGSGDIGA